MQNFKRQASDAASSMYITGFGLSVASLTLQNMQYLEQDVESTVSYAAGQNEADVLEWLLHLAISYLYEDMEESVDESGTRRPLQTSL